MDEEGTRADSNRRHCVGWLRYHIEGHRTHGGFGNAYTAAPAGRAECVRRPRVSDAPIGDARCSLAGCRADHPAPNSAVSYAFLDCEAPTGLDMMTREDPHCLMRRFGLKMGGKLENNPYQPLFAA
jgi:hypothetical protein